MLILACKVKVKSLSLLSDSLWPLGLYSPWNSPGQNTGVGSCSLLQGLFPTQRSNPHLPHCRWILYQLSHQGIPRILEWVAYPFSRGSSWPRNQTRVSCIAGEFLTSWASREALPCPHFLAWKSSNTYQFRQDEKFLGLSWNYSPRGKQTLVDKEGLFCILLRCCGHVWPIWSSSEISALSNVGCKPSFLLATNLSWKSPPVQNN